MTILALDPGPERTGWVVYGDGRVLSAGLSGNRDLANRISKRLVRCPPITLWIADTADTLAIEMVASYGMPVGREVFETVLWTGRFIQAWEFPDEVCLVYRQDVKLELCGTVRAKDANVRASLIDRFGPGRSKAIGTKRQPGPLYGVSGHAWAALAVAVCVEINRKKINADICEAIGRIVRVEPSAYD